MPGSLFIKFDGITQGESLEVNHKGDQGWIEISEWSFDITAESNAGKGQGSAVGKAGTEGITISHYVDNSSTTILTKMIQGQHFPLITIQMVKQIGSDAGGQNFFQVKVSEAFVSKVATKGSGESGEITQDVTFTFKEMKVCYRKQKNDGQLAGAISFNWSVKKNDEAIAITGSI